MMLSGNQTQDEMIKSVDKGIFAVSFGGGQVDITSGKFVFNCTEAYEINNGKIGSPIKGATLIGDGPSILKEVSMVGNDMMLESRDRNLWKSRARSSCWSRSTFNFDQ